MKCFPKIIGIVILLFFLKTEVKGQAKLGLVTSSISNGVPNLGDQLFVYTKLKNYSLTDTFNGVINFSLANQDSIITNTSIVGKPNFNNTTIKLAPQEEKAALFTVQLFPSYFKAGPDIIIVWPIAAANIVDTAIAFITIQHPLGVANIDPAWVHLFIHNNALFIENLNGKNYLECVQIFNEVGVQVSVANFAKDDNTTVSIDALPKGIYIARVQDNKGNIYSLKFVR